MTNFWRETRKKVTEGINQHSLPSVHIHINRNKSKQKEQERKPHCENGWWFIFQSSYPKTIFPLFFFILVGERFARNQIDQHQWLLSRNKSIGSLLHGIIQNQFLIQFLLFHPIFCTFFVCGNPFPFLDSFFKTSRISGWWLKRFYSTYIATPGHRRRT